MPSSRRPHVALATCAALPELDADERLVIAPLEARGFRVSPAVWDDPSTDWHEFDLVVVRSTWDYTSRRNEFVAWARSVPRLANPADVIEWNTDKRYLDDLARAGLPVIPTTWLSPGDALELPTTGVHVLKPSIGAGSLDADRFAMDDAGGAARAFAHAERLLAAGQTLMIQPYVASVERAGETGIVLLRGEYSHAITKSAMLGAPKEAVAGLYKSEVINRRDPSAAELELARRTLAAVPFDQASLLYARVDMLADDADTGSPMLIELELTEPSLFMGKAPGSEKRLADAIARSLATKGNA